MKKISILLIAMTIVMPVMAASIVTFMNKTYNLSYSKQIGKNSYLEVYNTSGLSNVIMKGLFTMEDAQSKTLQDEMTNATKDIINKNETPKLNKPSWSKMDIISNTFYIMGSCVNIDEKTQKYACTFNRTKYVNNNTQISMFIYSKSYNIPANTDAQTFLDSEYEKIKPNLQAAQ